MTVYLAGPMRGRPLYNFPAFHAAARKLRDLGIKVFSPADGDLANGFDPATDPFTEDDYHHAMRRDLVAVLSVDAVVVLPGWEGSYGATTEVRVAEAIGTPVIDFAALDL